MADEAPLTPTADGGTRLRLERSWPADIDRVWAALTEPEPLARWFGRYEGERATGATGSLAMDAEEGAPASPVVVEECDRPRRLVVRWADGPGWRLVVDLSEDGGRTTLVFTQVLAPSDPAGAVATGWHWYLDRLGAVVEGREPDGDWDAFAARVGPVYGYRPE